MRARLGKPLPLALEDLHAFRRRVAGQRPGWAAHRRPTPETVAC